MTHYTSSMGTDTVYTAVGNVAAGCSQANFNHSGSTDHVAKAGEHEHQLLTYSPWWACTAWAEISVLLCFCCALATQPVVAFALLTAVWMQPQQPESSQCTLLFDQNYRTAVWHLGPAPTIPLLGAALPVMWNTSPPTRAAGRHGADALCSSGSDGLSSQGWDLFLVVTSHKSKCCVKLLHYCSLSLSHLSESEFPSFLVCISRQNSWFFWVDGRIQISLLKPGIKCSLCTRMEKIIIFNYFGFLCLF